uniref:Uncharacterized protein n=1 Tax=Pavo cristatus TaxID=9049 RepID=A0A8C9LDR8_PAVCR
LSCFIGKKRNPGLKIPKEAFEQPQTSSTPPRDLDSKACISIGEENFEVKADDLEPISELGRASVLSVFVVWTRPRPHPAHF